MGAELAQIYPCYLGGGPHECNGNANAELLPLAKFKPWPCFRGWGNNFHKHNSLAFSSEAAP